MKAYYISRNSVLANFVDEGTLLFLFYMLTDELNMSCHLSGLFDEYNNRSKMSEEAMLNRFFETSDKFKSKEEEEKMRRAFKVSQKIKFKKHKTHEDLKLQLFHQTMHKSMTEFMESDFEVRLEDAHADHLVKLQPSKKINTLPFFDEKSDDHKRDDFYSGLIKKCILSKNDFHIFHMKIFEDRKLYSFGRYSGEKPLNFKEELARRDANVDRLFKKWWLKAIFYTVYIITFIPVNLYNLIALLWKKNRVIDDAEINDEFDDDMFSIILFRMPYSHIIEADKIKMIHGYLNEKMKIVSDKLIEFKSQLLQTKFNGNLREITMQSYAEIQPELNELQKRIDDEIYLQQLVHSWDKSLYYEVHASIFSISQIVGLYERNGTIPAFIGEALRKNISLQTDINNCDLVLFWCFREYV